MKRRAVYFLILLICVGGGVVFGQNSFYSLDSIQTIEVFFEQDNWDYQMDTAKMGAEGYTLARWVKINGVQYDSVGVKYKGNSSYDSSYVKNPLHISLDKYKNQSHEGIRDVKLGNNYGDPSMIREVLAYHILENYMHCPKSNFVKLYINGAFIGLYSNAEDISKDFCSDHFYSSKHTFVKCNPTVVPSAKIKSNLRYISADSTAYSTLYELKSSTGWKELVSLCDTVTNYPASLDKILDMDRAIWMLAFNNVLINLDSYSGVFAQNYYLYRDKTGHFNPIIWDLNMSFGGFPFLGYSNTSLAAQNVLGMQQLPLNIHETDSYWPMIKAIMSNPQYKRKYVAHMKTILTEYITSDLYKTKYADLQAIVKNVALEDTNKFFTNDQFLNGLDQNAPFSSYTVPGIATLMDARATYLLNTADFKALAPTIVSVKSSNEAPELDSSVTIRAKVTNASALYLNYRYDKEDKFTSVLMYDDGLHNDSLAGDGLYAASFTVSVSKVQYYVYADNSVAGAFSPARAEHEFYTLNAYAQEINVGEVVINEFMATNKTIASDETDTFEDWIELYNNASTSINLFGHHLSDDRDNLGKFTFPKNTMIAPKGYLAIWADEDATTKTFVHCNFKLSGAGEAIYLSNANGVLLDSIVFGAQLVDESMGRCPNGLGAFYHIVKPTFQRANYCVGVDVVSDESYGLQMDISPNPADGELSISTSSNIFAGQEMYIYSVTGVLMYHDRLSASNKINTSLWNNGIYMLKIGNESHKVAIVH